MDTGKFKFFQSDKSRPSRGCDDKPEPDFVPTREEVEQSRKLVEEVRRSTRDGESQPRENTKAARPLF